MLFLVCYFKLSHTVISYHYQDVQLRHCITMCFVLVIFLMYTLNSFHTLVSYASTQSFCEIVCAIRYFQKFYLSSCTTLSNLIDVLKWQTNEIDINFQLTN